jgi:hypothetical protein
MEPVILKITWQFYISSLIVQAQRIWMLIVSQYKVTFSVQMVPIQGLDKLIILPNLTY